MQTGKQDQNKPKRSALFKVLWAVAAVAVAGILFAAGYYTYYWTMDAGLRSLLWFKEANDGEYYEDIPSEVFWNAAIGGVAGL